MCEVKKALPLSDIESVNEGDWEVGVQKFRNNPTTVSNLFCPTRVSTSVTYQHSTITSPPVGER